MSLANNSSAEPRGKAGRGQPDCRGGKEDGHTGHNDTVAKVLDCLQLIGQLLLVHDHDKA